MHVLLMEDDQVPARGIARILRGVGMTVDCLVEPFAIPAFIARIRALVRRSNPAPTEMVAGARVPDTDACRALVDKRCIDLSVREWAVLEYSMRQTGRLASKQQLADTGVIIRTNRGVDGLFEQVPCR